MLLLFDAQMVDEDCFLDLITTTNTFLGVSLTGTKLLDDACLLKLLLELLEGAVYAFAFFYWNDQHDGVILLLMDSKSKRFLFQRNYPFKISREITNFWISEVPSPIVHSFESR